eukprot:CAMPEP_0195306868 /NCGR_PEP_ID=MMETSP0707-20130614/37422_1 /TAXON_ID=33640 /ORGANISM="Asterionellopsis glacialis, Strain CCMP134" /LENGTH=432 /DNA_ID=CAMNT_0040371099 /DNA_START=480 /DNA_END=1778 /DNA_ORIENTATION=+
MSNWKNRHRFIEFPVQDPQVLLDRLNTRRLAKRQNQNQKSGRTYQPNRTTRELAEMESELFTSGQNTKNLTPQLRLLRFGKFCWNGEEKQQRNPFSRMTVLASYPRSGNTLMRTLIERTTGIVTGSDTRPDRNLSKALARQHNLVGEGVVDKNQVGVVKTHFPERKGYKTYKAHRAIVLVRNPFDAIDSYWNLCTTNTHTETITDEVYAMLNDKFVGLVENEMAMWIRFHRYWLERDDIPILVLRFEDLIRDPTSQMYRVLEFLSDLYPLPNEWCQSVQQSCGSSTSSPSSSASGTGGTALLGSYRPRTATSKKGSIGKSLAKGRYSDDLVQKLHDIAKKESSAGTNLLEHFGYDIFQQNFPSNFEEGGKSIPEIHSVCPLTAGNTKPKGIVKINSGPELRSPNNPYGRAMTKWRHGLTNNDKNPFPTVPRS